MHDKEATQQITILETLNPQATIQPKGFMPPPRPKDLNGKHIGLWWNGKVRGDVALHTIREQLERRYKGLKFTEFLYSHPVRKEAMEHAARVKPDVMIATTGD